MACRKTRPLAVWNNVEKICSKVKSECPHGGYSLLSSVRSQSPIGNASYLSFQANALVVILIAALALSFGVEDFTEGGVIAAVIVINTLCVMFCVLH